MSVWKLKINGVESELNALGIQQFDLVLMNLGEDTLRLNEKKVALNTSPVMGYGDTVQLIQDTTIRFIGTCTNNPRVGMPGQLEARTYTCKNIIWDLNRIIYEQDWHEDEDNTYFKGRVKLGKDVDDQRVTVNVALGDVVGYAQNAGLSFSVNYPGIGTIPPDSEFVDITCFEAIRHLLNWAPSVATSVDYSTGTPIINFVKRASATSATFTATELQALSVSPRNDLLLDGVVINYEIGNNVDGEFFTKTQQDTAGDTEGLNVLRQTLELYGVEASSTEQEVEVVTSTMPATPGKTFFERFIPGLSDITDISITDQANTSALPRILENGSVPEWTGRVAEEAVVTAKVSGKYKGTAIDGETIAVNITLTDAESKKYSQVTSASYTPPEDIPTGLADALLDERSLLQYVGSISMVAKEPDWTANTSMVCNMEPGGVAESWDDAEAWDDAIQWLDTIDGFSGFDQINAVINSVRISHVPGRSSTTVQFGPPQHLGPQDIIEMARATRNRSPSVWSRKEPASGSSGAVSMGGATANQNGNMMGGGGLPSSDGKAKGMVLQLVEKTVNAETVLAGEWDHLKWR